MNFVASPKDVKKNELCYVCQNIMTHHQINLILLIIIYPILLIIIFITDTSIHDIQVEGTPESTCWKFCKSKRSAAVVNMHTKVAEYYRR